MSRLARVVTVVAGAALSVGLIGAPVAAAPRVKLEPLLSGYDRPFLVTHNGVSEQILFIVEQAGRIVRASHATGSWEKKGAFLDIRSRTISDGARGLMGLAFHPRYKNNGLFYVVYTRTGAGADEGDIVLAEFQRQTASKADPTSERILLVIPKDGTMHVGGHLAFGPDN